MKIFFRKNNNSAMSSALKKELKIFFDQVPGPEPEVKAVEVLTLMNVFEYEDELISEYCAKNQVSKLKLLLDYAKIYQP
jgi:hypothetical protein